jgi:hypothetical protein
MTRQIYVHHKTTFTCPYRGVCFIKGRSVNPWRAKFAGKILGFFPTAKEAATIYDAASIARDGQFAVVNFPRKEAA